jgi:hypothetical protein
LIGKEKIKGRAGGMFGLKWNIFAPNKKDI